MDGNFRNAVVNMPQSRDRLENGRSKNDEVSRRMWKAVETSSGEIGMGKAEGERRKGRSREETRRERQEKKTEKREDNGSEESSRRIGDLGWGGGSSKIRGGSKEDGAQEISLMD